MAQSWTFAHQQYVQLVQQISKSALTLGEQISELNDLAQSPAIAGAALTDAEIQGFGNLFQALTAAQVLQAKTDLLAILAVITSSVRQDLETVIVGLPR